jgi:hypothetical protein
MSRVITQVKPLVLFGQPVPGLTVVKSGDRVVSLLKNVNGKNVTLDGGLSQSERCKVYRALKKNG